MGVTLRAATNSVWEALSALPEHVLDPCGALDRGYAVVIQDVGTSVPSDGEWYPYANEAPDGHDTIDWIASQPCSATVVCSYSSAGAQLVAARGASGVEGNRSMTARLVLR